MAIVTTIRCHFRLRLIQAVIEDAICAKDAVTANWTFLWSVRVFVQESSTFWHMQTHYTVLRSLADASIRASY